MKEVRIRSTRRELLRYVAVAGGALGLGSVAAACAPGATAPTAPIASGAPKAVVGGTLTVGLQFPVQIADPHNAKGGGDNIIFANVYDRLVELDFATMKPQPSLATSWRAVNDTTWELKLRKDVKFSDGTPFNAAAAKANLERAATSPASQPFAGNIASVDAPDAETIVIRTKAPYAEAIFNLGQYQVSMIAPSALAKGKDFLATNGVGTGPFVIKEWVSGDRFVLERNPTYWKQAPKLDKVVMRNMQNDNSRLAALQAGDIDLMTNPPAPAVKQLSGDARFVVSKAAVARTYFIMYQLQDPIMKNLKVRQAIAAAINRKALVDQATEGLVRAANGWLPPEALDYAGSDPGFQIEYNPEKAKQLIKESGIDTATVHLQMLPEASVVSADIVALAIQEDLKKVGLAVDIVKVENAALNDRYKKHDYQLGPQGWGTPDPDTSLRKVFSERGAWHYPNLQDPSFEVKLDEAAATLDDAKRQAMYKGIFRDLLEKADYLPLFFGLTIIASAKKVQGFGWSPINGPFLHNTSLTQ